MYIESGLVVQMGVRAEGHKRSVFLGANNDPRVCRLSYILICKLINV